MFVQLLLTLPVGLCRITFEHKVYGKTCFIILSSVDFFAYNITIVICSENMKITSNWMWSRL